MSQRLVVIGLALACAASVGIAQVKPAATTPEQDEVFALLDRFDARDDTRFPFVKVAIGWPDRQRDGSWQNTYHYGFLLQSNGREFVVRLVDGNRRRLENTPAGTPEHHRVGFTPADFRTFADEHARILRARPRDPAARPRSRDPQTPVSPETQGLVLARMCARLGHASEMQTLWDALPEDDRSVSELTRSSLACWHFTKDLDSRTWLDFGDPTLTWQDLLARYDFLVETFADSAWQAGWNTQRDALKSHLARKSAAQRSAELATASVDELVSRLADVCLPQYSGGFDSWPTHPMDPGPAGQSAFDELVRRGPEVIPALIAHLGDKGTTRSWSYCSRFSGGFGSLMLGDNVRCTMIAIVGVEALDGQGFDWRRWYEDVKKVGLREHLLAVVAKTEWALVARTLLARFPDCIAAVLDIAATSEGQRRSVLLSCLVEAVQAQALPTPPRLVQLLEQEVAKGDRAAREQAADWLLTLGNEKRVAPSESRR